MIRIGLAGDVMLGRMVDRYVLANAAAGPGHVWGNTLPLWGQMDLRLVNLECVIATAGEPQIPKTFHFRAGPRAIDALRAGGIHLVSLANNHVLDFGGEALRECLLRLRESSIRHVGAGETIEEAAAPAFLSSDGITVAVVAVTDGEPPWEATPDRVGTNYVSCDARGLLEPYRRRVADALARARADADVVVVSAHVGSNWGSPAPQTRVLAHELVDLGADLYWGHSNHTVQGIELYRGKAVLYACGDFVDDYAVDGAQRNDLSCLFEVIVEGHRTTHVRLHPVRIAGFQVNLATGGDLRWMHRWLRDRMAEFITNIRFEGDVGVIEISTK